MERDQKQDEAAMAAWSRERSELLATIQQQQEDAERLAKRFKLLQRTLVDQQKLLDRYQQALVSSGALASSSANKDDNGDVSKANTAATGATSPTSSSDDVKTPVASRAVIKGKLQAPTMDNHRAVTAVNTARNTTSSILLATPVLPRVVTRDMEEFTAATSASLSTPSAHLKVGVAERPRCRAKPTDDATPSDASAASKAESSASWITRKADFHRAPPMAMQTSDKPEPSLSTAPSKAVAAPVHHIKGVKRKAKSSTDRAPTWAQEKLRMKEAGISIMTNKRRFTDLSTTKSSKAAGGTCTKGDASSQSGDEKEKVAFQYVEVVRNREARAALPGHDCVECKKYYEALNDLIPDADAQLAKAKCSRHRAKFEPYNTPDDFWRLSFPDSEPQPLSP